MKNLDLAAEYLQEAIDLNQLCRSERTDDIPILADLAKNWSWMDDVESRRGNHAAAKEWNERAAVLHETLAKESKHFGPNHLAAQAWHRAGWAYLLPEILTKQENSQIVHLSSHLTILS